MMLRRTPARLPSRPQPGRRPAGRTEPLNRFPRMMVMAGRSGARRRSARRRPARGAEDEGRCRSLRAIGAGAHPRQLWSGTRAHAAQGPRHPYVERDAYRIEMVVFESRPGFLVTGNLYVPTGRDGRLPGVVGVQVTGQNGKAAEAYQSFAQGLARLGYVVFLTTRPARASAFNTSTAPSVGRATAPGVSEHIQAGNQQTLVGEFLGAWFAWDWRARARLPADLPGGRSGTRRRHRQLRRRHPRPPGSAGWSSAGPWPRPPASSRRFVAMPRTNCRPTPSSARRVCSPWIWTTATLQRRRPSRSSSPRKKISSTCAAAPRRTSG